MLAATPSGDVFWVLFCALLVAAIGPGFIFFYGELFDRRGTDHSLFLALSGAGLVLLQWVLVGYSLTYGPDHNGWIGSLAWTALKNVGGEPNLEYAGTIPHLALMIYRAMLACLPCAILVNVCAKKIKGSAFGLFVLLWTTLVYDPVTHWIWGLGGFLRVSGVLDFAGGALHVSAAMAILAGALIFKTSDRPEKAVISPAPRFSGLVGTAELCAGWLGLSAANAFSAGPVAARAFVNFILAAASAGLIWVILDSVLFQSASAAGLFAGAVVGLVAISSGAGYVGTGSAVLIGLAASLLCYGLFVFLEKKIGPLGALFPFVVHGIAGAVGLVSVGLFASSRINTAGSDGFFYGNPALLVQQLKTILSISLYSFGIAFLLLKSLHLLIGFAAETSGDA